MGHSFELSRQTQIFPSQLATISVKRGATGLSPQSFGCLESPPNRKLPFINARKRKAMTDMRWLIAFLVVAMLAAETRVNAQRGYREIENQRELKRQYGRYSGKRDNDRGGRDNDKRGKDKNKGNNNKSKEKESDDDPAMEPSDDSAVTLAPTTPKGSKKTHNRNPAKRDEYEEEVDDKTKPPSNKEIKPPSNKEIKPPSGKDQTTKKKHRTKQSKKQMEKLSKKDKSSSSSYKGSSGKNKGKGKTSGDGGSDDSGDDDDGVITPPNKGCRSSVANAVLDIVPEVTTMNPTRCCDYKGPVGVYVTHALSSPDTESGFEPFWDAIYTQIATTSEHSDTCFVMTGYEPSSRSLSDILTDVTVLVSSLPDVAAMMVSDPTSDQQLMNEIRFIEQDPSSPSIGVFNAGYNNIVIESLVSGEQPIPYVGVTNDADFGIRAARFSKDALNGREAKPLCFNGRTELEFIGERCVAFYAELGQDSTRPIIGASCSEDSPVEDLFTLLVDTEANVVFSTINCCTVVSEAVRMARSMGQSIVAVGCQDTDTTNGQIDYVAAQPILLQGYTPASWVNFPVLQARLGQRGKQFFPSLDSIVKTDIYTIPIV